MAFVTQAVNHVNHGLSVGDKITIAGKGKAESLNASIAAAVLLSDWMED